MAPLSLLWLSISLRLMHFPSIRLSIRLLELALVRDVPSLGHSQSLVGFGKKMPCASCWLPRLFLLIVRLFLLIARLLLLLPKLKFGGNPKTSARLLSLMIVILIGGDSALMTSGGFRI